MAPEKISIIVPETVTYRGNLIEVITQRLAEGEENLVFERARRPPGVRLIITSESTGRILLTREYRAEIGGYDYRLPGGKVFDNLEEYNKAKTNDEDILAHSAIAAQKEALEETGLELTNIAHCYTSKCGATIEWDLHYFSTQVPTEDMGEQKLGAGEDITANWFTPQEVISLILNGAMAEDRSATVLLRYIYQNCPSLLRISETEGKGISGRVLIDLLKRQPLTSLRIRTENLMKLDTIDSVIIVGSSFVGKSTLVDAIREALVREPQLSALVSIPKRIITRPQRQNDNLIENTFRTNEEFEAMVQNKEIGFHWVRKMEGSRTESYGFFAPKSGTIPIYSANNAVLSNKGSVQPAEVLDRSLIITIYAPEEVRRQRLFNRSPDLVAQKPEEVAYRLADKAVYMYPESHVVVKNFGKYIDQTKQDVVDLVKLLIQNPV